MMRSGVLPPVPRLLARILLLAGLGLAPWAGATEAAGRPGHAAIASAHHLLADPGVSTAWKVVNTSYFMYFAVMASMIHGLTVPGAMEVAQRRKAR